MSAVAELERTVPGGTDCPRCSALIPVFLDPDEMPKMLPCPEPAVARVEGRCRCGHLRTALLCAGCAEQAGHGGCRACLEQDSSPHGCPLAVTGSRL